MGLIIIAAVDDRAHSIDLLDHRTSETLSESRAGKLGLTHSICCMDNACAFIWQVDAGPGPEIKQALGLNKLLFSHLGRNLHHTVITGVGDHLLKGFHSMGARICRTFNIWLSILAESLSAVAGKGII